MLISVHLCTIFLNRNVMDKLALLTFRLKNMISTQSSLQILKPSLCTPRLEWTLRMDTETTTSLIYGQNNPNDRTSKCRPDHTEPIEWKVSVPSLFLKTTSGQGADENINYSLDIGSQSLTANLIIYFYSKSNL